MMNATQGIQRALLGVVAIVMYSQALAVSPGPEAMADESATELAMSEGWQTERTVCSNRTLKGTYTYQFEGTRDDGTIRTREGGMKVYDGRGSMSVVASFNSVPGGVYSFQTTRLSYTVNANCTGVLSGRNGKYADIFVAPDESSFTFVSNVAGQQISGVETRVSRTLIPLIP